MRSITQNTMKTTKKKTKKKTLKIDASRLVPINGPKPNIHSISMATTPKPSPEADLNWLLAHRTYGPLKGFGVALAFGYDWVIVNDGQWNVLLPLRKTKP